MLATAAGILQGLARLQLSLLPCLWTHADSFVRVTTGAGAHSRSRTAPRAAALPVLPSPSYSATRMTLLLSQGAAEVFMGDPLQQLVFAVDFHGRVTHSIGPLSGGMYYSNFIPYVNSYAEIYSEEEVGSMFNTNDEAMTYKVPQASVKAEIDSN